MVRLLRLLTFVGGMPSSNCVVSGSPFTRLEPAATLHMTVIMALSVTVAVGNIIYLAAISITGVFR
jgi:hypothetical protein